MSKPVTVHTSVKQQQQPKVSTHILDDWTFTIKEHHIIDSGGSTRELPITQQWQEARVQLDQPLPLDKAKQYDWTYTTDYTGSMTGPWKVVEPSSSNEEAGLDLALLRRRDPISFFANLTLYEDELGDNGLAACNVKLRVMPANGFFILLRFFLRVDQLLVRCYDTRLQWRRPDP